MPAGGTAPLLKGYASCVPGLAGAAAYLRHMREAAAREQVSGVSHEV